jgi:hypothetical protein
MVNKKSILDQNYYDSLTRIEYLYNNVKVFLGIISSTSINMIVGIKTYQF